MSGNSHDRRVEARGLNYTQRVFDVLTPASWQTVDEIVHASGLNAETVTGALRRLRLTRSIASRCIERQWRYGLILGAARPVDRRGGGARKQMMAMAA